MVAEDRPDTDSAPAASSRVAPRAARVAAFVAVTILLFALVEGLSSLFLASLEPANGTRASIADYHPRIGWVGKAFVDEPDHWGPGTGVRTNSKGLRGAAEAEWARADSGMRTLCVGDSFTFGDGVGDEQTWCHLLGAVGGHPETVNLGHSGYGLGQSYLRYESVADSIAHSLVLFAFILDDVRRMPSSGRNGFPKPVLRLAGDDLIVDNVPVATGGGLARGVARYAERLQVTRLAGRLLDRVRSRGPRLSDADRSELGLLAGAVFREVTVRAEAQGAIAVFVYLPTREDLGRDPALRGIIRDAAEGLGRPYLDLSDDIARLSVTETNELFIPRGAAANGHYSPLGHRWIAGVLERRLAALPVRGFESPAVVGGVPLADRDE